MAAKSALQARQGIAAARGAEDSKSTKAFWRDISVQHAWRLCILLPVAGALSLGEKLRHGLGLKDSTHRVQASGSDLTADWSGLLGLPHWITRPRPLPGCLT